MWSVGPPAENSTVNSSLFVGLLMIRGLVDGWMRWGLQCSVQLSAVLTILCAASALAGLSRSLDEEAVEERVVLLP